MRFIFFISFLLVSHFIFGQSNPIGIFSNQTDIGNPKMKGNAIFDESLKTYKLKGGGYNIWFDRDKFHYLFNQMKGDFRLTADFEFVGKGVDPHRKIGWMIRGSRDEGAVHSSAVLHGDGLTVLQWRLKQNAQMRDPEDEIKATKKNYKTIQIERRGNQIIMRAAADGEALGYIGSHHLETLPEQVLAGLFICSHNPDVVEEAIISNVKFEQLNNTLTNKKPSPFSDEEILDAYKALRVADVSDGMDMVGLRDVGLVDTRFQALWKDINDFSHQFRGIAVTVRYMPTNKVVPNPMPPQTFRQWEGKWYNELSSEPFVDHLQKGSVVVIDASGDGDTGSVGSYNSLAWYASGAVGILSTGSIRDTDEIIKQKIPVYMDPLQRGRGIRPGRNEVESVNKPVEIGGVTVHHGDVIVADGDGVIVVPRAYAMEVARFAHIILEGDKNGRRSLYEKLGWELDDTVIDKH